MCIYIYININIYVCVCVVDEVSLLFVQNTLGLRLGFKFFPVTNTLAYCSI